VFCQLPSSLYCAVCTHLVLLEPPQNSNSMIDIPFQTSQVSCSPELNCCGRCDRPHESLSKLCAVPAFCQQEDLSQRSEVYRLATVLEFWSSSRQGGRSCFLFEARTVSQRLRFIPRIRCRFQSCVSYLSCFMPVLGVWRCTTSAAPAGKHHQSLPARCRPC
jgi:hypothetical protein